MSLSAASAASVENEQIGKPKDDATHDRVEAGRARSAPNWNKSVKRPDLSGFIGTDRWMVGQYER